MIGDLWEMRPIEASGRIEFLVSKPRRDTRYPDLVLVFSVVFVPISWLERPRSKTEGMALSSEKGALCIGGTVNLQKNFDCQIQLLLYVQVTGMAGF